MDNTIITSAQYLHILEQVKSLNDKVEQLISNQYTISMENIPGSMILLKTVDEINDYYDNLSKDIGNITYYRRSVSHQVAHPILSGGWFYLEGFRTTEEYEWQKLQSYSLDTMKIFTRTKAIGVWKDWTVIQ